MYNVGISFLMKRKHEDSIWILLDEYSEYISEYIVSF